jgi:hypothetical protein
MRSPDRLWQAIAFPAREDDLHRRVDVDTMSDGDIYRLDLPPRAQCDTKHLFVGDQFRSATYLFSQIPGFPDQNGLGASDRWYVKQHAQVAGEAKAAGMCQTMTIDDQYIRQACQLL